MDDRKYFINKRICEIMKEEQKKPCAIADKAGIRRDIFSRIIHNKRVVFADELIPICNALGTSLDRLTEGWSAS